MDSLNLKTELEVLKSQHKDVVTVCDRLYAENELLKRMFADEFKSNEFLKEALKRSQIEHKSLQERFYNLTNIIAGIQVGSRLTKELVSRLKDLDF